MNQIEIRQAIADGIARLPGNKSHKKNNKAIGEEEILHRNCHVWNVLNQGKYPLLSWIFHCPNGGGRTKAEAGILKAMGVKPGISDFILPFPCGEWNGLAIELKSNSGKLSVYQQNWLIKARDNGWLVGVARDLVEYEKLVKLYLSGSLFENVSKKEI